MNGNVNIPASAPMPQATIPQAMPIPQARVPQAAPTPQVSMPQAAPTINEVKAPMSTNVAPVQTPVQAQTQPVQVQMQNQTQEVKPQVQEQPKVEPTVSQVTSTRDFSNKFKPVEPFVPKPVKERLPIEEIKNNPKYSPEEGLAYLRGQESYKPGQYTMEDELDLARAMSKQHYDFIKANRENMSPDADKILESIKDGHFLTNDELYRMTVPEEQYQEYRSNLEQMYGEGTTMESLQKSFDDIRERTQNGTITMEDFDFLAGQMGLDQETYEMLRQGFMNAGKIVDSYETPISR